MVSVLFPLLKSQNCLNGLWKTELSPAYDLLNSSIVLKGDIQEIALPLKGKKSNLTSDILIGYFGKESAMALKNSQLYQAMY